MTSSQTNSSTNGCILILVLCPLLTNCPAVDRVNGSRFIAPCFIWSCSAAPTMFVAFKGVYTPEWTHSPQGSVYPTTPPTPITHVLIAPPPHPRCWGNKAGLRLYSRVALGISWHIALPTPALPMRLLWPAVAAGVPQFITFYSKQGYYSTFFSLFRGIGVCKPYSQGFSWISHGSAHLWQEWCQQGL